MIDDKDVLTKNKKINSNIIEAISILLCRQVGEFIVGLQLVERVPFFSETEQR